LEKFDGVTAAFVAGVESATWGQAVAAYVAVADAASALGSVLAEQWHGTLGLLAPKTVLPASELIMLPNGKPDRLAMIERLNALHQGR
ncbi:MAG: AMP-dependent synthetase, partial [Actinomycetota bacterium]|nr:AMP-dependent synthetase [Actinomycetota bacterium]